MEKKMISFEGSDELKEELRILAFEKGLPFQRL